MASRFWERGDSSDEEESVEETSSEEESDSDESTSSSGSSESDRKGASKFLVGSESDSDEDDRRVVRSAKDRRGEELKATCDEIRNKMHINDWSSIQTLFDKLNKQLEKTMKASDLTSTPRPYIRLLAELEDFLMKSLADKAGRKKMSATNARALNTMRQRVKKHNAGYQKEIEAFREHPVSSSEDEPSGNDSDASDSEAEAKSPEDAAEDAFEKIRSRQEKKRDKLFTMDPTEITYEMVTKKLREIVLSRGKKGIDRSEQVEMLEYLAQVSKGPVQKLEVLVHVVSALFDINPSMSTHMPLHLWKKSVAVLYDIMDLLAAHPYIVMDENYDGGEEERSEEPPAGEQVKVWGNLVANVERLDDELFKSLQVIDPHTHKFMQRLQDEPLFLALAQKTCAYLERRGDTAALSRLILRRIEHLYYKNDAVYDAMRRHVIAKQEAQAAGQAAEEEAKEAQDEGADLGDEDEPTDEAAAATPADKVHVPIPADFVLAEDVHALIAELTALVYKYGDERTKARASICATYMRCIHDDFYTARDMLLMSHLQDNVNNMDISTQILYNRTMGQLGLCAFRAGLVPEAHSCLSELYSSGRVKELLAQGMSMNRWQEKTPEQEKLERRRQMPFHMHINLELLESCHLICAMLLEVPNMAASSLSSNRRVISKHFRRLLDNYDRQTFTGPPENVRDHVMAATKALTHGDWAGCYGYLSALSVWNLVPRKDEVLAMLKERVQVEALRTYLFAFGPHYASVSLDQLASTFQLSDKKVHSVVSKMMIEEHLAGSWDQPTRSVVMHNAQPSRLQSLASDLSDRAAGLVDLNERALQLRTGRLQEDDDAAAGPYGEPGMTSGRGGRGRGRGRGRGFLPMLGDRDGGRGSRGGRGGRGGGRFTGNYGYVGGYSRITDYDRGQPVMTQLGSTARR